MKTFFCSSELKFACRGRTIAEAPREARTSAIQCVISSVPGKKIKTAPESLLDAMKETVAAIS